MLRAGTMLGIVLLASGFVLMQGREALASLDGLVQQLKQRAPSEVVHPRPSPTARQAMHAAWAEVNRAERALTFQISNARLAFEESGEYRGARQALQQARRELNAARQEALASLQRRSDYRNAVTRRQQLQARIDEAREQGASDAEITALATEALGLSQTISKMQQDAYNANADHNELQQAVTSAGTRLTALEQSHAQTMKDHPGVVAARQRLCEARAALQGAQHASGAASSPDVGMVNLAAVR